MKTNNHWTIFDNFLYSFWNVTVPCKDSFSKISKCVIYYFLFIWDGVKQFFVCNFLCSLFSSLFLVWNLLPCILLCFCFLFFLTHATLYFNQIISSLELKYFNGSSIANNFVFFLSFQQICVCRDRYGRYCNNRAMARLCRPNFNALYTYCLGQERISIPEWIPKTSVAV